jgi:hypothetical protein
MRSEAEKWPQNASVKMPHFLTMQIRTCRDHAASNKELARRRLRETGTLT